MLVIGGAPLKTAGLRLGGGLGKGPSGVTKPMAAEPGPLVGAVVAEKPCGEGTECGEL
jgi:hypothetical protein